jgi:hypothetical protein
MMRCGVPACLLNPLQNFPVQPHSTTRTAPCPLAAMDLMLSANSQVDCYDRSAGLRTSSSAANPSPFSGFCGFDCRIQRQEIDLPRDGRIRAAFSKTSPLHRLFLAFMFVIGLGNEVTFILFTDVVLIANHLPY